MLRLMPREVPRYVQPLYRPPSEARSLIFQVTYGCSSDTCTFCRVYRGKTFRKRNEGEVLEEFEAAAALYPHARRIFLADGDALVLAPRIMLGYLDRLHALFPDLERVTAYATPQNLLRRSPDDLRAIREAGLAMLYIGIESGSSRILDMVRKGVAPDQHVEACLKAGAAGFDTSLTVILGLGGPELSEEHAVETGRVLTACRPTYIGALTLMLAAHNADFPRSMYPGWRMLDIAETLREVRLMLEHITCDGATFRANHASNWLSLKGRLMQDRPRLLSFIDEVLADPDSPYLRPDEFRAL